MEEKIKFWIVRDAPCSDIKGYLGELNLCSDKPYKDREDDNYWTLETEDGYAIDCIMLPPEMFPDITWESDPVEVEVIIRRDGRKD